MPNSYMKDFESYLTRRKSVHTQSNYLSSLQRYLEWLKGRTPNEKNLEEFLNYLSFKQNSARSLNRHMSALKTFFKHCMHVEINLESYLVEHKLPVWLNDKETLAIQTACANQYEKAVINTFLKTGVRVSEAASIKLDDISYNKHIRVMGKGAKERFVPCMKSLSDVIDDYVQNRKEQSELLFPRGVKNLEEVVRTVAKRAGIKKEITAHKLRHTFASKFYAETHDLAKLRDILGHADISITGIYVHLNDDDMNKDLPEFMKRI